MPNIFSLLPWRKTAPTRLVRERAEAPPDEEHPRGCGWFDSSHDLQQGLLVQEREPDAVAAELPLAHWLDLQLSGWRATSPT
jgi:hypothetical protein